MFVPSTLRRQIKEYLENIAGPSEDDVEKIKELKREFQEEQENE